MTPKGEAISFFYYSSKNLLVNEWHISVHLSSKGLQYSVYEAHSRDIGFQHILITFTFHKLDSGDT